ncbi:hypothetical protein DPEC_G00359410 [Dallia pectoralis]|uniref:Uncharacterized protein n=1 Tax=Dallia pectoralis TaxID=75939 RepID=A0ACC2F0Y0_DALPE|nr:hypothetical protein DPEC_G00359410 [Dallia pectoralis]
MLNGEPLGFRLHTMLMNIKVEIPYLQVILDTLMPPMVPNKWASTPPLQDRPLVDLGRAACWMECSESKSKNISVSVNGLQTRDGQEPSPTLERPSPPGLVQEPRLHTMLMAIKVEIPYLQVILDTLMPPMVPNKWASTPPLQDRPLVDLGRAACWMERSESKSKNISVSVNGLQTRDGQEPSPTLEPLGFRFHTMLMAIKVEIPYLRVILDTLMPPMVPNKWASTPPLQYRPLVDLGRAACWMELSESKSKNISVSVNGLQTRDDQEPSPTLEPPSPPGLVQEPRLHTMLMAIKVEIPYLQVILDTLMPPMVPNKWASTPPLQDRPLVDLGRAACWMELSESKSKNISVSVNGLQTRDGQEPSPTLEPLGFRFHTMLMAIKVEIPYLRVILDTLMPPMVPNKWASTPPLQYRPLVDLGRAACWMELSESKSKNISVSVNRLQTRDDQEPSPTLEPPSPPGLVQEPRLHTMLMAIKVEIPYLQVILDTLMPPMVPNKWASTPPLQDRPLVDLGRAACWMELSESKSKNISVSVNGLQTRDDQEPSPTLEPLGFRFHTMLMAIKVEIPYLQVILDTLMPPMVPKKWASTPPLPGRPLVDLGRAACWVEVRKTTAKTAKTLNRLRIREAQEPLSNPVVAQQEPLLTIGVVHQESRSPSVVQQEPTSPSVVQQEPTSPRVVQQEPTSPSVVQQEPTSPGVIQQEPTSPSVVQQEPTSPSVVQQEPTSPSVVQQEPTSPSVVQQEPTSPSVVQQEPTSPSVVQQEPTSPGVIQQEPTSPSVVQQEPTSPSVVQQEPTSPSVEPLPSPIVVHQEPLLMPHTVQEPPSKPVVDQPQTRPYWMCGMNSNQQMRTKMALIHPPSGRLSQAPPRNSSHIWRWDLGIQENGISMLNSFFERLIALITRSKPHHQQIRDPHIYFIVGSFLSDTMTQKHLAPEPLTHVTQEPLTQVTLEPLNQVTQQPQTQVTEEPLVWLIQEPLTQGPVNQVTQEPQTQVTQEPLVWLIQEPLTQGPLTQGPLNQVSQEPQTQGPLNQVTQEHQTQEPLTQGPLNQVTQEHQTQEPLTQGPLNQVTQVTQEPLNHVTVVHLAQKPVNLEALAQENQEMEPLAWIEGRGLQGSWSVLFSAWLLGTWCLHETLKRLRKAPKKALRSRSKRKYRKTH